MQWCTVLWLWLYCTVSGFLNHSMLLAVYLAILWNDCRHAVLYGNSPWMAPGKNRNWDTEFQIINTYLQSTIIWMQAGHATYISIWTSLVKWCYFWAGMLDGVSLSFVLWVCALIFNVMRMKPESEPHTCFTFECAMTHAAIGNFKLQIYSAALESYMPCNL